MEHAGKTIKILRKSMGWSQEKLGEAVGAPKMRISRLELGRVRLRLDEVPIFARVLGIDVTKLVPREPAPRPRKRSASGARE